MVWNQASAYQGRGSSGTAASSGGESRNQWQDDSTTVAPLSRGRDGWPIHGWVLIRPRGVAQPDQTTRPERQRKVTQGCRLDGEELRP